MMSQQSNGWDTNITKVNSLGEISKLMPALTPREEVQPELVLEEKKMNKKETIRAALEYSIAHPNESQVLVAQMFGISTSAIYNARFLHKKRLLKGAKKKVNATTVPEWAKAAVSTSLSPVKQDMVNHPPHYKAGGIETIDFIEAKQLNYNLGNVVKYITRADLKGERKENLEKALWYLKRELGV